MDITELRNKIQEGIEKETRRLVVSNNSIGLLRLEELKDIKEVNVEIQGHCEIVSKGVKIRFPLKKDDK